MPLRPLWVEENVARMLARKVRDSGIEINAWLSVLNHSEDIFWWSPHQN